MYTLAYLCRNNLSVALSTLEYQLGAGKTGVAMLGSLFYWCYAGGKLVNGYLGDYLNNKHTLVAAAVMAGTCNMLMGVADAAWQLALLWALNGFAQSALWCNMLRVVSRWFDTDKQGRLAVWLSTSMMVGSLAAYVGCGLLMKALPYQWCFVLPGALMLLVGVLWLVWGANSAEQENLTVKLTQSRRVKVGSEHIGAFIISSGLLPVTVACLAQGMVKDSIGLWGPTMLEESFAVAAGTSAAMLWLLPVFNIGGVLVVGVLRGKRISDEALSGMLMGLSALLLVGMWLCRAQAVYVALLCTVSALMYGVNTLLLTLYPLRFAAYGRVSFVSGFLDASAYVAAGAGSLLLGNVLDGGAGWNGAYMLWLGIILVSIVFLRLTARCAA